ncbi:MAG: hypothetical protein ACREBR_01505 [bacterium]
MNFIHERELVGTVKTHLSQGKAVHNVDGIKQTLPITRKLDRIERDDKVS